MNDVSKGTSTDKTDVVVIGAGAVGLAIAYELTCRGRQVTVIDQDWIDDGSNPPASARRQRATSLAASGILPPANLEHATDPIEQLRGLSHQLFPELADRLKSETGIDSELERCGGWYLADTPGEIGAMVGMKTFWHDLAIECTEAPLSDLAKHEPALDEWTLRNKNAKAWWVPDEYQIRPPNYLRALAKACVQHGGKLLGHCQVTGLSDSHHRASIQISNLLHHSDSRNRTTSGPSANKESIVAEQVVVCGGVWTGKVAERLQLQRSIVPVRGQILLLHAPQRILHSVVNVGHRYVVPRGDGHVLVGSCEEEVGMQHGTTPRMLQDLREFAFDICPEFRRAREVDAWSGLRPMTFDGFPMCGKLPDSESIFVASGHFRSGVHLSPGTAHCMADLLCGQTPQVDLDAFRVGKQQNKESTHS